MTPKEVEDIHALVRVMPLNQITSISANEIASLARILGGDDFREAVSVLKALERWCDSIRRKVFVCAVCGCETNVSLEQPCIACGSSRVATLDFIEAVFGPNWRAVFKSMRKGKGYESYRQ